MSLASDELDESQITAKDLPLEFKVNLIFCPLREFLLWSSSSPPHGPLSHKIAPDFLSSVVGYFRSGSEKLPEKMKRSRDGI